MVNYIWPILLVVLSNTLYQICSRSVPGDINPLAALVITYIVGAVVSAVLYFALNRDTDLVREWTKINWAPFVLGVVIVGLEVGFIYAYKAGWPVSMAQTVASSILAIILILVGRAMFNETITWNKVAGIIVCLGGIALINWK